MNNTHDVKNEYFMSIALNEAIKAFFKGEVPVGCVIVKDGKIISRAHNLKETLQLPTAHAEILAINKAAQKLGSWYLDKCDIYITAEPCLMCAGAIWQGRLRRVYFGAYNPKGGAIESSNQVFNSPGINHKPEEIRGGILNSACSLVLSNFFKEKRKEKKKGEKNGF